MAGYLIYLFLGSFLALSALIYANLLIIQFMGLRFGWNDQQMENLMLAMLVLSLSFLWYSISLSFTLYNKWILQEWHSGFHFPILMTTVHMIIKYLVTRLWAVTPDAEEIVPTSWKIHSSIVIPIGLCTSADIVFSNIAISHLPLSMYTTIKGSTVVFTFLLGVFCKIEHFKWTLFLAVLSIVGGLGMAIFNTGDQLSAYGLICVMLSAFCSAIRWVLMQVFAVQDEHSSSVMVTMYRISPYSMLSIIPFALLFEAPLLLKSDFNTTALLLQALLYSAGGGLASFFLLIAEVKLLRVTSSLTMCVIGQIKEIIQIGVAMVLFKDNITIHSGVGIMISIIAAYWYRHIKYTSAEEGEDLDERQATMQILQSSQLAHMSVRHSTKVKNSNNNLYNSSNGVHNEYVGVDTEYNVPHSAIEDEIESLLFNNNDVDVSMSEYNPMATDNEDIEMTTIGRSEANEEQAMMTSV